MYISEYLVRLSRGPPECFQMRPFWTFTVPDPTPLLMGITFGAAVLGLVSNSLKNKSYILRITNLLSLLWISEPSLKSTSLLATRQSLPQDESGCQILFLTSLPVTIKVTPAFCSPIDRLQHMTFQYGISQLTSHRCSHALPYCFRLSWRHQNMWQGFFSSEFGSVLRTKSQCQIVSFFPKKGTKIPNLLQTAKVKTLSTKIEYAMHKFQKTRSEEG